MYIWGQKLGQELIKNVMPGWLFGGMKNNFYLKLFFMYCGNFYNEPKLLLQSENSK